MTSAEPVAAETAEDDRSGNKGLKFGFIVLRDKGFGIWGSKE